MNFLKSVVQKAKNPNESKNLNEAKNQFSRSNGAFRGRGFALKGQSKAPTIPTANLQTQSSQVNKPLTDHKVSNYPPANSPKNVPSPKLSIMDVSIGTDKQGNPTEINVFITKEQYERFGGKLNDFSFNFGENIDERVQNLVKQGKVNCIILTKEQEQILLEKRKKAANEVQQQSNEKTVKITEEDVGFQQEWIDQAFDIIDQIKNEAGSILEQKKKFTSDLEAPVSNQYEGVIDKFYKLLSEELLYSKDANKLNLKKYLTSLEGINEIDVSSSKYLKNISRNIIAFLQTDYPESLKCEYLWNRRLNASDINA